MLLLEQQGTEQRRLDLLQEEQRQLQAKRKNKQALLDELVRGRPPQGAVVSWCCLVTLSCDVVLCGGVVVVMCRVFVWSWWCCDVALCCHGSPS